MEVRLNHESLGQETSGAGTINSLYSERVFGGWSSKLIAILNCKALWQGSHDPISSLELCHARVTGQRYIVDLGGFANSFGTNPRCNF